jgi:hypothetical protein
MGLPGLFIVVKSKLRWRVPVTYDDWRQVVCSAIFRDAMPDFPS